MGYYVTPLGRPYDFKVFIEAYIYTKRNDFVHPDFKNYYTELLRVLEEQFETRLFSEGLSFNQSVLWSLFENTITSLLRISTPWDNYLEEGLVVKKLQESGETGKAIMQASSVISEAAKTSQQAHREILYNLFVAIFGSCEKVITSKDLLLAGFDDSREPKITDYFEYF